MFESIKIRIIKGRKLNPFATAKVLQEHEDRLNALESAEDDTEPTPDETPVTRNISFSVIDGTSPVQGATVTIGEKHNNTGSAGGCTLQEIAEGEQTVTVNAAGFEDYTGTITVTEENTAFTITINKIVYDFISYDSETKDNEYATGTAQATGDSENGYIEIEVLTNTVSEFVGNYYYITADANPDGETAYQLYEGAGTKGTGIYVTITLHE